MCLLIFISVIICFQGNSLNIGILSLQSTNTTTWMWSFYFIKASFIFIFYSNKLKIMWPCQVKRYFISIQDKCCFGFFNCKFPKQCFGNSIAVYQIKFSCIFKRVNWETFFKMFCLFFRKFNYNLFTVISTLFSILFNLNNPFAEWSCWPSSFRIILCFYYSI